MFTYTVYPRIENVSRVESYRPVERTPAVNGIRAVESVWNSRFTEAVQSRHRAHAVQIENRSRADVERPRQTEPQSAPALEPTTSEVSGMQIQNSRETVLEQRGTKPASDGEYIRKYVQQLNEARDRTLRQRQSELQIKELRQNNGSAKSALVS